MFLREVEAAFRLALHRGSPSDGGAGGGRVRGHGCTGNGVSGGGLPTAAAVGAACRRTVAVCSAAVAIGWGGWPGAAGGVGRTAWCPLRVVVEGLSASVASAGGGEAGLSRAVRAAAVGAGGGRGGGGDGPVRPAGRAWPGAHRAGDGTVAVGDGGAAGGGSGYCTHRFRPVCPGDNRCFKRPWGTCALVVPLRHGT